MLILQCEVEWDELDGDHPVERRCSNCERQITNLSSLSEEEVAAFATSKRGEFGVCVRYDWGRGPRPLSPGQKERLARQRSGLRELLIAAAVAAPMLVLGCDDSTAARAHAAPPQATSGVVDGPDLGDGPASAARSAPPTTVSSKGATAEPSLVEDAIHALKQTYRDIFEEEPEEQEEPNGAVIGSVTF